MKFSVTGAFVLTWLMGMALPLSLASADREGPGSYLIGQGDVLSISVWKDEALTKEVVVLPDGTISFPLVGILEAEGRSVQELKRDVTEKLKRFVPDPTLSLEIKVPSSMHIYVLGCVNNPGRFSLNGTVNVLQALAMAGGLNPFAENNGIKIFRAENGTSSMMPFRYDDVVKGRHLEQNILLGRGDVVVVP